MLKNTNTNETAQSDSDRNIAFVKFPHSAAYDSELYKPAHRNALALLCYLSAMANHDPTVFSGITVLRGQYVSTKKRLAEVLGISEREVRTAIDFLVMKNFLNTSVKHALRGNITTVETLFCVYTENRADASADAPADALRSKSQISSMFYGLDKAKRADALADAFAYINKNKYNKNKNNNVYIGREDVFYGDSLYDDPDKIKV